MGNQARIAASAAVLVLLTLTGCGASADPPAGRAADPAGLVAVQERMTEIGKAVDTWQAASSLTEAQAAAGQALALVTGPGVTGYDGASVAEGLLPGEHGEPGLASGIADCAGPDLLGGSWTDPPARWDEWRARLAAWTPSDNTFPLLTSHPQRIAGWAELTVRATDLAEAEEYAGHAQLHVAAADAAVADCR